MSQDPAESLLSGVPRMAVWPFARALGQRMICAAHEGDWISALKILEQRNAVLQRYFDEPVSEEEGREIADAVRGVMKDDEELQRLTQSGRIELKDKLRNLRTGRKARHAYLSGP